MSEKQELKIETLFGSIDAGFVNETEKQNLAFKLPSGFVSCQESNQNEQTILSFPNHNPKKPKKKKNTKLCSFRTWK